MISLIKNKLKNSNNAVVERKKYIKKFKNEIDDIRKVREDMGMVKWSSLKKNNKTKNSGKYTFQINNTGILYPEKFDKKKLNKKYFNYIISYSKINLGKKINEKVENWSDWEDINSTKIFLRESDSKYYKIGNVGLLKNTKYNKEIKKINSIESTSTNLQIQKTTEKEDRQIANQILSIIAQLNELFDKKDREIAVSNLFTLLKDMTKPQYNFERIMKGDKKEYLVIKEVAYKNLVKDVAINGTSGLIKKNSINNKIKEILYKNMSYGISKLEKKPDYEDDLDDFILYLGKIQKFLTVVRNKLRDSNNSVNVYEKNIEREVERFEKKINLMEQDIIDTNNKQEKVVAVGEYTSELAVILQKDLDKIKNDVKKYNRIVKIMKGSEFRKKIKSRPRLLIEKKDEIKGIEDEIVYRTIVLLRKVYKVISSIFGQPFKKIPNKIMGMLPSNIRQKVKTEIERVRGLSGSSTSFGSLGSSSSSSWSLVSPLSGIGSSTSNMNLPSSLVVNGRKIFIPYVSKTLFTKTYGIINLSDTYDSSKAKIYTTLTDKRIKSLLYKNGFLVVNVNDDKINNPVSWKVLKYDNVKKALNSKNDKERQEFIVKLLSDPGFYVQKTTGWGGSKDTVKTNLKKFCGRLVKKKRYSECDFITSIEEIGL